MTTKPCQNMALSQFELSKIVLKNLNQFDLSPTAKLVLLTLVDCYNPKNNEIYPKQITIAEQLGISISSVKRAVKELAAHQIVIYELKNTNRYKMTSTFFELLKLTPDMEQKESSSSIKLKPPCHEHKKEKIINTSSYDDESLNNNVSESLPDLQIYKEIINKLDGWTYLGAKRDIKQYGIEKMNMLCKLSEKNKADNKGAYIRRMLNIPLAELLIMLNGEDKNKKFLDKCLENRSEAIDYLRVLDKWNTKPKDIENIKAIQTKWNFNIDTYPVLTHIFGNKEVKSLAWEHKTKAQLYGEE